MMFLKNIGIMLLVGFASYGLNNFIIDVCDEVDRKKYGTSSRNSNSEEE